MELERILHRHGFGSRKACRTLIRSGRVAVNGENVDDPFVDVDTTDLIFSVDGVSWPYRGKATIVLNKPAGYECSRRPIHHPSVYALLPIPLLERGLQSIGRLDEDTTGLLLFSDDGQLNHVLTSPKHKVPKIYRVQLKHPGAPELVQELLHGVLLHDEPEPIVAAACTLTSERELLLTVTEGKYHQVKRMIAAAGNRVDTLHREMVGGFRLPADLAPGQWIWLEPADLGALQEGE